MREPGLEPGSRRWQRRIVPLDHSRCADNLVDFQFKKILFEKKLKANKRVFRTKMQGFKGL